MRAKFEYFRSWLAWLLFFMRLLQMFLNNRIQYILLPFDFSAISPAAFGSPFFTALTTSSHVGKSLFFSHSASVSIRHLPTLAAGWFA